MKLLLENWRKYLNEEEYSITPEQNQALKKLYVVISRFVIAAKNTLKSQEDPKRTSLVKLSRSGNFVPEDYGFEEERRYFQTTDESLFKELPPMKAPILAIDFKSLGPSGASLTVGGYPPWAGAKMRLTNILDMDDLALKSMIQHELHHFFTQEHMDQAGAGVSREDEIQKIKYIFDEGEIRAHTKQYAYLYHKLFPEEEKFNPEKFVDEISNRNIRVGRGPMFLYQKTLLEPHVNELGGIEGIKQMNNKAIKYTQYFLTLFKRRNQ